MANASLDAETVRRALEVARNSEDGNISPHISAILDAAVAAVWRRVQSQPNTYVMTPNEHAVFNYFFQTKFQGNEVARRAVQRYWHHRQVQ